MCDILGGGATESGREDSYKELDGHTTAKGMLWTADGPGHTGEAQVFAGLTGRKLVTATTDRTVCNPAGHTPLCHRGLLNSPSLS